ncbi:MAG: glycosyl hydrolase family 28-related protein [Armatimonadota bacterium]|nr:glycosyl hydrolase family 28 protein [Armatimonadota bacterium]MCX7777213.1 glycosyl hydrolase family 28 protein [Armatimonadota bacterium]MDW8024628.1 glycosyl hydrolase family 28-related protein [Armatimonadota bacterium]
MRRRNFIKALSAIALLYANPLSSGGRKRFNVHDFGAKGDKVNNDRTAIQSAIDACAKSGGGVVYFPPGDYLTGTLRLRSGVTLFLDAKATIWVSRSPEHFESERYGHLILAENERNIAVVGSGKIQGYADQPLQRRERGDFRYGIILFEGCHDVIIRDITILYSDSWTIHLKRCEKVLVEGVTIRNNYDRINSDGINPNCCKNVRILKCDIVAGDDCIALKTTEPYPCEDVEVRDCVLETRATALKLGTESHGIFRNARFSGCTIRNSTVGIGFFMKDGGIMENIIFSDINIEPRATPNARTFPIFMDIERRHEDSKIGFIRNVTLQRIYIRTGSGLLIQGMPKRPIEGLTMRDIKIDVVRAEDYSERRKHIGGNRTTSDERDTLYARQPSYVTIAHVKGLNIENLTVNISEDVHRKYERSALCLHEVEDGTLARILRKPPTGEELPIIALHNCRNITVAKCEALHGTKVFLGVSGRRTNKITLKGNRLRAAKQPVRVNSEVPKDSVILLTK